MLDYTNDIRRGAVRIEVLINRLRVEIECDVNTHSNSKELALQLKQIYTELLHFSDDLRRAKQEETKTQGSVWDSKEVPKPNNVIPLKSYK